MREEKFAKVKRQKRNITRNGSATTTEQYHYFGSVCHLLTVSEEIKFHKQMLYIKDVVKKKVKAKKHWFPVYMKTVT